MNDTGTSEGRQVITAGKQHTEILLVEGIAYLRANEEALRDFFGFPADEASRYADDWLSFTISDAGYGELVETLDMPSLIENITLTGDLTKTAVITVGGKRVIGIRGEHPQGGTGTSVRRRRRRTAPGSDGHRGSEREQRQPRVQRVGQERKRESPIRRDAVVGRGHRLTLFAPRF